MTSLVAAEAEALGAALRHGIFVRLASLDVRGTPDDSALRAVGEGLLDGEHRIAALKCDAFEVSADAVALDLSSKRITAGTAKLLAGLVKINSALQSLKCAALTPLESDSSR